MGGMEFTWRMVATLAWPGVVLAVLVVYRKWITGTLTSLRLKVGSVEAELNAKVDATGREISGALSEMPQPGTDGKVPASLVDLMPAIGRDRSGGIRGAFSLVRQALTEQYPQLRRVPPSQLAQAMQGLVDNQMLDADVAVAVNQLYELLELPGWTSDPAGDAHGYAFLMLAEGAIHGILRSAEGHTAGTRSQPPDALPGPVGSSWRGIYNNDFPIELQILTWSGDDFTGEMNYPDGDTSTSIHGSIEVRVGSEGRPRLLWTEDEYIRHGRRDVELEGRYQADISGTRMHGTWGRGGTPIAIFEMDARSDEPA